MMGNIFAKFKDDVPTAMKIMTKHELQIQVQYHHKQYWCKPYAGMQIGGKPKNTL